MATLTASQLEAANLEKTWNNFDVNNVINTGVEATNLRTLFFEIKTWLKTITGMSVRNSCLDASVSASDLITAYTDIVLGATGTWIVLEHTSGYQVMLAATSSNAASIYVAPLGGLTTGTSSVNPTTTLMSSNLIGHNAAVQVVWSGGASSDGKCWYYATYSANAIRSFNGVFEGYLMDTRSNSSQYVHLYGTTAGTFPSIGAVINNAQVTLVYLTYPGGWSASAVSATQAGYGGKYWASEVAAGTQPSALTFAKLIDIFHAGTGLFASGDRALSAAAAAEMISPGVGWLVPWNNTVLQKI